MGPVLGAAPRCWKGCRVRLVPTLVVKHQAKLEDPMLVLGIILLVIGFVTGISILWTIGIVLLVVGAVLWILGAAGHAVGGRKHYW